MNMNQESDKKLTLQYGMIQSIYWMSFSILIGYSSNYLLGVGFNSEQIGILIAAAGLLSAILQPIVATYVDKRAGHTLKNTIIILSIGLLFGAGILFLIHGRTLWGTGILYAVAVAILQMMTALINSLGMYHESINFGVCRGMGSIFYAVIASVIGSTVAIFGVREIPVALLIAFVLLILSVFFFPSKRIERKEKEEMKDNAGFFQRNPGFLLVMISCTCIYISHVLINNYLYQIVVSHGGGSREMGFAMTLACMMEIPMMFVFVSIMKKASLNTWITISCLAFTLKAFFSLLAPNMLIFYMVQVFQMAGWGIFAVALVYYVHQMVSVEDEAKGQAYITVTYSLGTVVASFMGGIIIERISVDAMLIFASVMGALGTVIHLINIQRKK